MFLLIVLFGERHQPGIGEGMTSLDPMRHELIHLLYLGPLPHSQIVKRFKVPAAINLSIVVPITVTILSPSVCPDG